MLEKIKAGKVAMLAHPAGKYKVDFKDEVFIQPKLDGVRCLFTKDGAFSRNGKQFMNVDHLTAELGKFFQYNPEAILDGELYNHSLKNDFNKIISLVRKTVNISDDDRAEAAELVQYHVYDLIEPEFPDASYVNRSVGLALIVMQYGLKMIKKVKTTKIVSQQGVDLQHTYNKEDGFEGSILRLGKYAYENKRSKSLIKVKDFMDFEGQVIGFVEGKGKLAGRLGKFLMKRLDNGKEFGAPPSAHTHEQRKELWDKRYSYLNTVWTVEAFEFTNSGAPRFPILKGQRNYE